LRRSPGAHRHRLGGGERKRRRLDLRHRDESVRRLRARLVGAASDLPDQVGNAVRLGLRGDFLGVVEVLPVVAREHEHDAAQAAIGEDARGLDQRELALWRDRCGRASG
jgi:hypothetical protein